MLQTLVFRGPDAILAHRTMLEQLAERFGQCGAMNWLPFFFSGKVARFKSPRLVLLLLPDANLNSPAPESVFGCALFSEYIVFGFKTGAVSTEDTSAFRTVLSLPEHRGEVARLCAARLVDEGAHIVLATYAGGEEKGCQPRTRRSALWTSRERIVGSHLQLASTYEEMLAGFSKKMRIRLRSFRRRVQGLTTFQFVEDVKVELDENGFLSLNRGCLNPVIDEEAALRWRASHEPGGYAMGLRTTKWRLAVPRGWVASMRHHRAALATEHDGLGEALPQHSYALLPAGA